MDKNRFNELMKNSKVRDYSYAVIFLLVSSFFAIAVIKPVLSVAVSLDREKKDLLELNQIYQKNIDKVIEIQNDLDAIAQERELLDSALPSNPNVSNIIGELSQVAIDSGLKINNFQIDQLELDQSVPIKNNDVIPVTIHMTFNGSSQQLNNFVSSLNNQRRLKTINNLKIEINKLLNDDIQQEIKLNFQIDIFSYYISSSDLVGIR